MLALFGVHFGGTFWNVLIDYASFLLTSAQKMSKQGTYGCARP
jgi:hypothetical protein